MSEVLTEEQKNELNQKKAAHDYLATAINIITTRVHFYVEEFEGTWQTVSFLKNMLAQIKADIEKIEPPKPIEPQKPYIMDLSHVKGEETKEAH